MVASQKRASARADFGPLEAIAIEPTSEVPCDVRG
jgi:hypothetical protein